MRRFASSLTICFSVSVLVKHSGNNLEEKCHSNTYLLVIYVIMSLILKLIPKFNQSIATDLTDACFVLQPRLKLVLCYSLGRRMVVLWPETDFLVA